MKLEPSYCTFCAFLSALFATLALAGQAGCEVDADEDGWSVEDGDCNDDDASVYPGADEVCDDVDNDCDGEIDELGLCQINPNALVETTSGLIQGIDGAEGTYAFLGIPYAKPPIGALRWQPPEPVEPWDDVFLATEFGPICPQRLDVDTDGDGIPDSKVYGGDEDCLTLDVWRPAADAASPRAIMVWIHGGGNTSGAASESLYEGAYLAAREDVVVISIQYRLNFLGWMRQEALDTGDPYRDSGNLGLFDQVLALNWIRDNAAAFGGDPENITVFGESAGGFDIWALMLSPYAAGAADRAIIESGCPAFLTPDYAQGIADALLEALVVADGLASEDSAEAFIESQSDEWIRNYLYGKSAEELMDPYLNGLAWDYDPILDGVVLPEDAFAALEAGNFNRMPLILGANRDETKLWLYDQVNMTASEFDQIMNEEYGDAADDIVALYPRDAYDPASPYNQYTDIEDNALELLCSPYMGWLVSPYQPSWLYRFQYDDLLDPYDYVFGACHATELPFVFGTDFEEWLGFDVYPDESTDDRALLTERMMDYWGCFARRGDPSACDGDSPEWPLLRSESDDLVRQMILDAPDVGVEPLSSVDRERINYWLGYYGYDLPTMPVD